MVDNFFYDIKSRVDLVFFWNYLVVKNEVLRNVINYIKLILCVLFIVLKMLFCLFYLY